jgi:RNA-directed DNA polymerase
VDVWRTKYAQGDVVVVRYADDIVLGFQHQAEADRFLEKFRERLGKFGLELHPDKTRRIEFGRYAEQNRKRRGEGRPETFDFLGFTHISGKNGKGYFTVKRRTIRKRMRGNCNRSSSNSASACTIQCHTPANGSSRSYRVTSTTTRYRGTWIV